MQHSRPDLVAGRSSISSEMLVQPVKMGLLLLLLLLLRVAVGRLDMARAFRSIWQPPLLLPASPRIAHPDTPMSRT